MVWRSAIEGRPADVISQTLVVENERANLARKLVALPLAFATSYLGARTVGSGGSRGPDRIGSCPKFVRGNMRDCRCLTSGIGGKAWSAVQIASGGVGVAGGLARLFHGDFPTCPSPSQLDRVAGPWIERSNGFEEWQGMLRARRCPQSQELMVGIGEGAASSNGDESRITDLGKNHARTVPKLGNRRGATSADKVWARPGWDDPV